MRLNFSGQRLIFFKTFQNPRDSRGATDERGELLKRKDKSFRDKPSEFIWKLSRRKLSNYQRRYILGTFLDPNVNNHFCLTLLRPSPDPSRQMFSRIIISGRILTISKYKIQLFNFEMLKFCNLHWTKDDIN